MKAETLRKSILQYAIQGKLVEQIETEEPATVLLEKIKAEKQELIKRGKIKKEKPLTPVTDDEKLFDLPESWEWVRFNDVAVLFTGDSINAVEKKKKYTDLSEGYNYIATKDIGFDNVIDYDNGVKIPFQTNFKVAKANSTLLCIEGGSAGRKVGILNQDVCFGNKLCSFEPILLNELYLLYFLQSPVFTDYFKDNKTGMIGGVGVNTLKTLPFALPSLAEQQRIVARIEELMVLVDKYESKEIELSKLEKEFSDKLKKSILQYAIQGKLVEQLASDGLASDLIEKIKAEKQELTKKGRLKKDKPLPPITDEEKSFEIPECWEWVRLGEISNILRGASPRPKGSPLYWTKTKTEYNWITISDIKSASFLSYLFETKEHLTQLGSTMSTFVDVDEIIIAVSGSTTGKSCVTKISGFIYDGLAVIHQFNNKLYTSYLAVLILQYYDKLNSSKVGSAFPNINTGNLKEMLIPIPPLAEQQRIVARIEELFALVDLLAEGKKLKTTITSASNEQQVATILEMPTKQEKAKFDVSSLGLAARAGSDISEQTIASVLKQVQDHYDKKN